jgi:hypothetical protein
MLLLTEPPAIAQPARHIPVHPAGRAVATPGAVFFGGRYIGQDPDPNIRFELLRDAAEYLGED